MCVYSLFPAFLLCRVPYALHPTPEWGLPTDQRPGNHWVYQNTVVDVRDLAPAIDAAMAAAGIEPVDV